MVVPTVGHAVTAAGYDRDFSLLHPQAAPPERGRPAPVDGIQLEGRVLSRSADVVLDLNGVVKGMTVDDALAMLSGPGFVSAGGDLAVNSPLLVALPCGGNVTVRRGGLATSGTERRSWWRSGERLHHLIDPATGSPSASRWVEVSVSGASCLAADVGAKAALLLDGDGPDWLDGLGLPGRFVERETEAVLENASWQAAMSQSWSERTTQP
jgi:thiamine biosynthesis lipoprotein